VSTNAKIATVFTVVLVLGLVAALAIAIASRTPPETPAENPETSLPATLRDDTHILDEGPTDIVLVEFLDFECEACGAFYPYVEELRTEFAGEVTFAFRYFPLPGHGNSVNAAVAVEAASRQGQLEPMYARLFESQAEWGEKGSESQAPLFRQFAQELGLDMAQFDADVADPAVLERVQSDFNDGLGLGVESTPTFFLNDRKVELTSFEDLKAAIEAELAR
jgi:protein-disulfide isomerase